MPQKALLYDPDLLRITPMSPARHIRGRENFNLGSELMVGHKVGLSTDVEIPSGGPRRRDTNVISMLRSGEMRLPIERAPALAHALGIDEKTLIRTAMTEYMPETWNALAGAGSAFPEIQINVKGPSPMIEQFKDLCLKERRTYLRRSRAETKMHSVNLLGQSLMARDFDRQVAELQIRAAVLNGYTALGIPITEPIE
ncbi:hypothetical protein FIU91_07125 [Roseivivax sp. THAF30]|nr:hypothetical protein FIU91_07125 [Roseivivax sp. THAF30]